MKSFVILLVISTSFLGGCATSPHSNDKYTRGEKLRGNIPVTVSTTSLFPQSKEELTSYPALTGVVSDPSLRRNINPPRPLRNPEEVSQEWLGAYVDENGNIIKSTEKVVVTKPATWNMEAVRSGNGYIPPANQRKPLTIGGYDTASDRVVKPMDQLKLFDLSNPAIRSTGLIDPNAELDAQSMAGKGEVAMFFNKLGWVIIPQAVLEQVMQIEPPRALPSKQETRPVTPVQKTDKADKDL